MGNEAAAATDTTAESAVRAIERFVDALVDEAVEGDQDDQDDQEG